MRCRNCGNELKNIDKFCSICGTRTDMGIEHVSGVVIDNEKNGWRRNGKREKTPDPDTSDLASEYARGALGSVFVLLGTLALLAQTVLMIYYSFSYNVWDFIYTVDLDYYFGSSTLIVLRAVVIFAAVTELLLFLGFLITFISANRKRHPFRTGGLSLLQALCITGLVIICIVVPCAVVGSIIIGRYYSGLYMMGIVTVTKWQIGYIFCMIAFWIAALVLAIIFFAKLISSIERAKQAAARGYVRKNISLYNVVMLFFAAVCLIAFALISVLMNQLSSPAMIAGELCLAAACIFYAVFMIMYRVKMSTFLQNY